MGKMVVTQVQILKGHPRTRHMTCWIGMGGLKMCRVAVRPSPSCLPAARRLQLDSRCTREICLFVKQFFLSAYDVT
ncbi:hypothetical protein Ae201684_014633 [Aphanomyces euteiches]|uniref:Uncharacterized protein n=1 Tax=Aphanomyces euteiches TaxID=100861 RepID=A0A6G0WJI5_9STRA|nr:hypothetical protein Ae201684_014633 [Aphanomyces euteiches]